MKKQKAAKRNQRCARRRVSARGFVRCFPPFIMIMLILTVPVFAEGSAGDKLAEGIEETATGWVAMPEQMSETTQETNVIEGVTLGAVQGAGEAVKNTLQGVVDTATFYVPDSEQDKE
jgi:putative exosortase-associated protein (TIGR04073 family)